MGYNYSFEQIAMTVLLMAAIGAVALLFALAGARSERLGRTSGKVRAHRYAANPPRAAARPFLLARSEARHIGREWKATRPTTRFAAVAVSLLGVVTLGLLFFSSLPS